MRLDSLFGEEATHCLRPQLAEADVVRAGAGTVRVALQLDDKRGILLEPLGDGERRRARLIVKGPLIYPEAKHDRVHDRHPCASVPQPIKAPSCPVGLGQRFPGQRTGLLGSRQGEVGVL